MACSANQFDRSPLVRLLGVALFGIGLLTCANPTSATPVTFRFEAEINTVFEGIPFDSGIDFSVGDIISGQFAFEPAVGDVNEISFSAVQPYHARLFISGVSLQTPPLLSNLEIKSTNNSPAIDYRPATEIDSLVVGSTLTMESPMLFPNISTDKSSFLLSLRGTSSILAVASHPEDVDVWNMFKFERQMLVSIRGNDAGVIGFQASIRQFTIVPEASTVSCIAGLLMFSLSMIRYHQTSFTK